jgi:hypothetical protein
MIGHHNFGFHIVEPYKFLRGQLVYQRYFVIIKEGDSIGYIEVSGVDAKLYCSMDFR